MEDEHMVASLLREKEDSKSTSRLECLIGLVPPFLTFGATFVVGIGVPIKDFALPSTLIALGMSVLSLMIDGVRYALGTAIFWPKAMDLSLCILWLVFSEPLLCETAAQVRWLRLYSGLIMGAVMFIVSCISILINQPWIFQLSVEMNPPKLWKEIPYQSENITLLQKSFKTACAVMTAYWALLFLLMLIANAVNVFFNTTLQPDDVTLTHQNSLMHLLLAEVWIGVLIIGGNITTPWIGKKVSKWLLAQNIADTPRSMSSPVM